MIPKIIHYCWFGDKEMPELAQKCIASWKQYLPDYELRLWNEETFDLDMYPYAREAYDNRKFAFVTDVVRLWALNEFGGIYMDTDVEILKPLDDLLHLPAFTGYEGSVANAPVTGLMASEAKGIWVREMLSYYDGRHFIKEDGKLDLTPNTDTIAKMMTIGGFNIDGKYHVYKDNMHVFPVDYFCPLSSTRVLKLTKNSYCIHHFAGSWIEYTRAQKVKKFICEKILGRKVTNAIVQMKRTILGKK